MALQTIIHPRARTTKPQVWLILVSVFIVFATATSISASWARMAVGPAVGQKAPDFIMTDMKGQPRQLKKMLGKDHVLLIFWSTRCPYCKKLTPAFKKMQTQYKGKGVLIVGVNIGPEKKEEVDDYIFEHELNYLVLNDDKKKAEVATQYKLQGTPTLKLIGPDGRILWHGHGIPDLSKWIK